MSPSPRQPEFFVDRSLGRYKIAAALRAAGWRLQTHHEVYGARDESVPDVEWLERCGKQGLTVLSKDRRLRYRPAEIAAIRRFGVRAFVLTTGNLTAASQAQRFIDNAARIWQAVTEPGHAIYAVHAKRIERFTS